ncbi:hypothetical protein ABB31_04250 [Stenotrophomonas pavanii]|nr:hypothetical protein ABB31_04250 [Stenotrophomonas pavanii]
MALHLPVDKWAKDIALLESFVEAESYEAILDLVEPEGDTRSVLIAPPEVIELRREIHELGEIGGAIAQASFLLNEVRGKWDWIDAGRRGDLVGDELSRSWRLLEQNVEHASHLLKEASRLIDGRLRQTQWIKVRAYVYFRRGRRIG